MKKLIPLIILISLFFINKQSLANKHFDEYLNDTSKVNFKELQTLKLYPNPANTYFYADYEIIFLNKAKLIVYNSIGSIIFTKEIEEKNNKFKIDVSDFKNGLYFCSLEIDGKLFKTKKIIINHH